MRKIIPVPVTTSNLDSSSIAINSDGYNEWVVGTTYVIGNTVYKGTNLYESLVDANTGNDPATTSTGESPKWLDLGRVNTWRMFDEYTNTLTTGPAVDLNNESKIVVVLDQTSIEYLSMFNLDAVSLKAELLDSVDTVLWSTEVDLFADVEDVGDWYEYFFGDDTDPHTDAIIQLGWMTFDERIRLTITNLGTPAECGMACIGRGRVLGQTQYNPEVSILDYSRKSTDDFGRTYLKQGNFAKMIKATIIVDVYKFDSVRHFLAEGRGTACVWDFNEDDTNFNALLVYGVFQDFRLVMPGPNYATCSLDIQGLI